jgi:hypothetical protein
LKAPDNLDVINEIKQSFLDKCIKGDIDNEKTKNMAQRAAWLGNDEAHYERKSEGKDLVYFVNLIKVVSELVVLE